MWEAGNSDQLWHGQCSLFESHLGPTEPLLQSCLCLKHSHVIFNQGWPRPTVSFVLIISWFDENFIYYNYRLLLLYFLVNLTLSYLALICN